MKDRYAEVVVKRSLENWCIIECTDEFLNMAGYTREELETRFRSSFSQMFSVVDIPAIDKLFTNASDKNALCPWIFTLSCAEDHILPVLLKQTAMTEDTYCVQIFEASFLGEQTEKMGQRIQTLEKSIPSGMCQALFDDDFTILWHNEYFLETIGYTQEQFETEIHSKGSGYICPDYLKEIKASLRAAQKQGKHLITTDVEIKRRDGEIRILLATLSFTGEMVNGIPVLGSVGVDVTDKRRAEQLEIDAKRLKAAMAKASSYILEYDVPKHMLMPSDNLEKYFGIRGNLENVPESLIEQGFVNGESADVIRDIFKKIENGNDYSEGIVYMCRGKRDMWFRLRLTAIYNGEHSPIKAILLAEDITERRKVELRYLEEEKRRAAMTYDMDFLFQFNLTTDEIITVDKKKFPYFDFNSSNSGRRLIRRKAAACVHPDDRAEYLKRMTKDYMMNLFEQGIPETTIEYRVEDGSGSYRWHRGIVHVIKEPVHEELCAYIYMKDIEKEKRLELELRRHAEQDVLTGLYNRYTVELYCDQQLEQRAPQQISAMYMMDLDNFKYLNDTYGHLRGDDMLRQASEALFALFGDTALLGRLGGDEMVIFQADCPSYEAVSRTAQAICDRIKDLEAGCGVVTASVGVSFAPRDGSKFAELYHCADNAVYLAKRSGKNGWAIYEKDDGREVDTERLPVSREWLLEESSDIIYVCDFYSYDLLYMNLGARKMFGVDKENYVGKKCYEVLQHNQRPCDFCTNHLLCRESFYHWEFRNETVGRTLLLRDRIVDWYGVPARIEFATDVSMIDKRAQVLQEQVEVDQTIISCLRAINDAKSLRASSSAMLEILARFHKADRAFILEYDSDKDTLVPVFEWRNEEIRSVAQLWGENGIIPDDQVRKCFQEHTNYSYDKNGVLGAETPYHYQMLYDAGVYRQRGVPFFLNGQPAGFIGLDNPTRYQDDMAVMETLSYFITEELSRSRLSDKLSFLSYHDSLTGLWNRNQYVEYMESVRHGSVSTMGIAVADINALKDINKLRGHTQGDMVVKRAADLLRDSFPGARIFRLSGDEFVVHCENEERQVFLDRVEEARNASPSLEGYGISVGYAWTDKEINCSKLTLQATDVMVMEKQEYYRQAKEGHLAGKHNYAQVQDLLEHMKKGHFKMYLQPKAGCDDFGLNGAEALVRFDSPETGVVSPDRFIPALEQGHMIRYIDLFIFEEVCGLLARWIKDGKKLFTISLNFSRQTVLEPNLLKTMQNIVNRYQVPKDCIEIEITESIGDYENSTIAEIGSGIKSAGYRLALDDFGSYYTNMQMLSIVPADVLKLDRSLVRNVLSSESNKLVLKSVLLLCRDLGISSIAEGVETDDQLELLRSLACDSIQGYLFGRPVPVDEFEKLYM